MTQLMGVLNITPDSFSDGGKYTHVNNAVKQVEVMVNEGATIIDLGAESTRPGAFALTSAQEWQRLAPVLDALKQKQINAGISIDSYHEETIQKALDLGIDWVNDVSGKLDTTLLKNYPSVMMCAMHSLTVPAQKDVHLPDSCDPVQEIYHWAKQKVKQLMEAGIDRRCICIDPGLGFGKTAAQSLAIIEGIDRFKSLGVKILVGHSRKSFLRLVNEDHDKATLEITKHLAGRVDYLRVHDVAANRDVLNA